jgi:hypothetical protein
MTMKVKTNVKAGRSAYYYYRGRQVAAQVAA